MSGNRHTLPEQLPGATAFSDEPELLDPMWAVRKLKQNPQWLDLLEDATTLNRDWGRPRLPGSWALAYLAFVLSGRSDIEPWAATVHSSLWSECGFGGVPSYPTIYNRFNRWRKAGIWDRLMDAIIAAHDGKVQMIDSTIVRVHQQAAAQKNKLETLVSVEVVED